MKITKYSILHPGNRQRITTKHGLCPTKDMQTHKNSHASIKTGSKVRGVGRRGLHILNWKKKTKTRSPAYRPFQFPPLDVRPCCWCGICRAGASSSSGRDGSSLSPNISWGKTKDLMITLHKIQIH